MESARASVRVESRRVRLAELGPENPLPMVGEPLQTPVSFDASVPVEIVERAATGYPRCLHPYRAQDGYSRVRTERELRAVVLENERLTAVFLPELGGRLWELVDRPTGTSLVHTPPAIQFANLALRNAWFAGGIEFNIGTRGHSPTTCSPLHAALLPGPDGTEVLRMWEYERLRGVVTTIDAWLPPGSPSLYVRVTVRNPGEVAVPMYWWTNAAVPQVPGTRVVAPGASAFRTDYDGGVTRVDPRDDDGVDCTWPARNPAARDFFFDLPQGALPWIAAVDEHGGGLTMLSTAALPGRKLFTWERPGRATVAALAEPRGRRRLLRDPVRPRAHPVRARPAGGAGRARLDRGVLVRRRRPRRGARRRLVRRGRPLRRATRGTLGRARRRRRGVGPDAGPAAGRARPRRQRLGGPGAAPQSCVGGGAGRRRSGCTVRRRDPRCRAASVAGPSRARPVPGCGALRGRGRLEEAARRRAGRLGAALLTARPLRTRRGG